LRVGPRGIGPPVLKPRIATVAAVLASALAAAPARAQAPEIPLTFSATSVIAGQGFLVSGVLPGGAADAGRPVELWEQRAPFPGTYAIATTGTAGPSGEFSFPVTPVRKAYWSVVAETTSTRPRLASPGILVAVRRKVSIRTSTRRPRKGRLVRFSGFVSPSFPLGPESVATLQRRNAQGGFTDVRGVRLRAAGTFSSYRLRVRVTRSGVYRVVVPTSVFFSAGASVAVTVRVRRG
jgi:hypothetical protein